MFAIITDSPIIAMLDDTRPLPKPDLVNYRVLTPFTLLVIVYMLSCGGPSGIESLVGNPGPLVSFLALVAFVVCYALPFSYLVAELCSAFPDDGGISIWVQNAFGDLWGFVAGFCMWFGVIVSCEWLPKAIFTQLTNLGAEIRSPVLVILIKASLALVIAIPTLLGTKVVAKVSIITFVGLGIPLVVLCIYCFAHHHNNWSALMEVRHVNLTLNPDTNTLERNDGDLQIDWKMLMTSLFYRFDGVAMISVFGGEVANPAHSYSFAIFAKLALTVLSYVVPLMCIVVFGRPHWSTFVEDSMIESAKNAGSFMHGIIVLSVLCGSLGLYVTVMFSQAYLICGMAHAKMIPRQFGERNDQFHTPHFAVAFGVLGVIVLVVLGVEETNPVGPAMSSFGQLIVVASAIRLRMILPDAVRPTRFPGGTKVMCCLMVIPVAVLLFTIYTSLATFAQLVAFIALLTAGFGFGFLFQRHNKNNQNNYENVHSQRTSSMHYLASDDGFW